MPFYVYLLTDVEGSRELIGQIYLKVDTFLSDVRRAIDRNRDLSQLIESREYRFLNENLDTIIYQESSLDLQRVFPSQTINIQYLRKLLNCFFETSRYMHRNFFKTSHMY